MCGAKRSVCILMVIATVAVMMVASGCHSHSDDAAKWRNDLVLTFNGHEYQVSDVKTSNVGGKIGTISYHGNYPYAFELYSVKGVEGYTQIAVRTRDGFLLANIGKSVPSGTTSSTSN